MGKPSQLTYQLRRSGKCVRFARPGLAVTKRGTAESFDRHLDQSLDAGVLQHIVLCGARFEHDVVGEQFRLLGTSARGQRNSVTL